MNVRVFLTIQKNPRTYRTFYTPADCRNGKMFVIIIVRYWNTTRGIPLNIPRSVYVSPRSRALGNRDSMRHPIPGNEPIATECAPRNASSLIMQLITTQLPASSLPIRRDSRLRHYASEPFSGEQK